MMVSPSYWSNAIIVFSEKPYFHWFEVITRVIAGFVFIVYSQTTLYPQLILVMGCILVAVGIGLVVTGSAKHRQFAVWTAHKFKNIFRSAGMVSFAFGGFLIYLSTSMFQ